MNNERRKIKFATEVISGFRGIGLIIYGVIFIITAVIDYFAKRDAQTRNGYGLDLTYGLIFFFAILLFWFVVYPKIKSYFVEKYGKVSGKPATTTNILEGAISVLPFVLAFLVGGQFDAQYQALLSLTVLFLVVYSFIKWWLDYKSVSNSVLYLSIFLLLISFAPWEKIFQSVTFGQDFHARFDFYAALAILIFGIIQIVCGLTDFIISQKILKPVSFKEDANYESV